MSVLVDSRTTFLEFNAPEFREKFPDVGFQIRHHLCDRPEFQLSQLAELAQQLPEKLVEYYSGEVSVAQRSTGYPKNGLSVVETVRRIEECGSWMVLKNVETHPVYAAFLRVLLDEWYAQIDSRQRARLKGKLNREQAFIFISSPGSVTPYHMDDEHNFLLQIRGTKQVHLWNPLDRSVVGEDRVESHLQYWHDADHERYMPYQEDFERTANVFRLGAGEGLHFPFGAPHWVQNGPEVSISFSITFRSELSDRMAMLYFINRRLRSLGVTPTPPGKSQLRDSLKLTTFQGARRSMRLFKGGSGRS
jgi:hypothetical protein